ncbi:hypothetical protein C8Q74DRAFT_755164 [Fomes fomentarius]|nr:hypothetical protein C8Q74DRAFT_755164 [Fomes fomentarius]
MLTPSSRSTRLTAQTCLSRTSTHITSSNSPLTPLRVRRSRSTAPHRNGGMDEPSARCHHLTDVQPLSHSGAVRATNL